MFEQVDLTDAKLEKEFGMGCLQIKGAHLWPLEHFVWNCTATEVSATFFGEEREPWDAINMLRIEVYKLPKAKKVVAERIEWYTRDAKKRRIRIADGELFDPGMLHVKGLDDEWEQRSFARSKREVIRIYQRKQYAVFFRFLAKSGTLLDHPIFKRVVKNIQFVDGQWEKSVPDIIDTRPKSKRATESPLTNKQEAEMWQIVKAVLKNLKLAKVKVGPKRLGVIEKEIEAARKAKLSKDEMIERAIELGTFVGQTFCWELDWEWCNVKTPDGSKFLCVCSPDRSLMLTPAEWVLDLISSKKRPLNCVLTYNMIEHGRLPPGRPYGYARIG